MSAKEVLELRADELGGGAERITILSECTSVFFDSDFLLVTELSELAALEEIEDGVGCFNLTGVRTGNLVDERIMRSYRE